MQDQMQDQTSETLYTTHLTVLQERLRQVGLAIQTLANHIDRQNSDIGDLREKSGRLTTLAEDVKQLDLQHQQLGREVANLRGKIEAEMSSHHIEVNAVTGTQAKQSELQQSGDRRQGPGSWFYWLVAVIIVLLSTIVLALLGKDVGLQFRGGAVQIEQPAHEKAGDPE